MPLAASGAISIGGSTSGRSINLEFGRAAGATTSMSQLYRGGGIVGSGAPNVPTSGPISLSQFYNAANQFALSIVSNQTNANLRTLAVNAGWDQSAPLVATIESGVYISSNSTGTPALTINGSFPGGVSLTNNGFIVGMGGAGGRGGGRNGAGPGWLAAISGGAGGLALSVSSAITINNAGTIAGGGGGGGGGGGAYINLDFKGEGVLGGGGGGGGRSSAAANSSAGTGGISNNPGRSGAAGGVGTVTTNGGGGAGNTNPLSAGEYSLSAGGNGGSGGGWGAGGSAGVYGTGSGANPSPGSAGPAGAAVSGNSNITWTATGTRLGAIT